MVHRTRLDAAVSAAAIMRQALSHAIHHAAYRSAFQRRLIDQRAMQNVLADLAIESEAATTLVMRIAHAFDQSDEAEQRAFARIATAITKYWISKRAPDFVFEAMECHGGNGYVEESALPQLYREAPVNSIWEGCGNVICLDVLRAMQRNPEALAACLAELERARGADRRLDRAIDDLRIALADDSDPEARCRMLVERMALALQGALLVRHASTQVADAFCASRLGGERGLVYGTLPAGLALREIVAGAWPNLD
jgi:putative acyl-CoA dehydrogenase